MSWGNFGGGLARRSRAQLLARLNVAAAWVLRERRRAVVWEFRGEEAEPPLRPAAQAACCLAMGSLDQPALSAQELVLAGEAAGLAAAALLAEWQPLAGSSWVRTIGSPMFSLSLSALEGVY